MVRALVSAVEGAGGDRDRFLAATGIAAERLDGHGTWLRVGDYKRAIETALEVTDDPALGLHIAEQASSAMFQLLAHLVEHAATLGEALDMVVRYVDCSRKISSRA